jgi:hypothetical protein
MPRSLYGEKSHISYTGTAILQAEPNGPSKDDLKVSSTFQVAGEKTVFALYDSMQRNLTLKL